jgi:hypothetical protein
MRKLIESTLVSLDGVIPITDPYGMERHPSRARPIQRDRPA